MAMKIESSIKSEDSVKIKGDLGDLQITELSDSEDDSTNGKQNSQKSISTISNIPPSLIQTSTVPVFGSVAVTNSDNVQFGNNTYFNGPVTIKQIVQNKSGIENGSYTKTEEENEQHNIQSAKLEESLSKNHHILLWHKLTFSAVCITMIGGIIAIILVLQSKTEQQTSIHSTTNFTNSDGTPDPLLVAPYHIRIVSRTDWLAQPVEGELDKLAQPVPWVIITHTATESCNTQSQCVLRVRLIQTFHIESRGWDDIGYNFLVGGDGSVYFGRGWDYEGAHTKGYNRYSIGIAFIGTFNNDQPPKQQVEACEKIIKQGVQLGKLSKDYKLFAHRQLMSTLSPGDKLFDIIKEWPHFVKNDTNIEDLLPKPA